ncbi:MAG: ATP-binding cassette domain-containing protein [Ignisphaera sp.]|jgi:ABC-type lipoprotein export system ATPase subunit|nr:ATP-binding cassette domain-containing protein [Ignisphaera sp.]
MSSIVVSLRAVSKAIGGDTVLNGVDLEIGFGQVILVRGKSGVGKTTLAKIVALLLKPDKGDVVFLSKRVNDLAWDALADLRLRYIGYIDQLCKLMPNITAFENIELPLKILGIPKRERIERVHEVASLLNIKEKLLRYPNELSGGERQRVAIARALVKKPRVVVADEPFAHLDDETMRTVLEYVKQLAKHNSMAVLITTTDLYTPLDVDEEFVLESGVLRKKS